VSKLEKADILELTVRHLQKMSQARRIPPPHLRAWLHLSSTDSVLSEVVSPAHNSQTTTTLVLNKQLNCTFVNKYFNSNQCFTYLEALNILTSYFTGFFLQIRLMGSKGVPVY